jgi:hypothetical protein
MDAALLSAGISAALAAASYVGGKSKSRPSVKGGRQYKGRRLPSSGADGFDPFNSSDLAVKPISVSNVPTKLPKNIASQIFWDVVKLDIGPLVTSVGTISESGVQVRLNSNPQYTQLTSLFDQYAIPFFSVIFRSNLPPGATTNAASLWTALDFDNVGALGSIQAIGDYNSSRESLMTTGKTVMRSVRPSPKAVIANTGSNSNSGVTGPIWLDCGDPTVPHYGIRWIASASGGIYQISVECVIYMCFRNTL